MFSMNCNTSHWYPVLRSRELKRKPVGRTRFGSNFVFWRDSKGKAVAMHDRCAHRGAALSLGRVRHDAIECPFHGFCFNQAGLCIRTPAEGNRPVPEGIAVPTLITTEQNGYVWVWRGPADSLHQLPLPPQHDSLDNLYYGEASSLWNAHFTRCIENVCDFSHLSFVHSTTIGLFRRSPETEIEIEERPEGFRAWLIEGDNKSQYFEFLYPNLWLLRVQNSLLLSAVFVPVNEQVTEVYGRSYAKIHFPGSQILMNWYTQLSQYLVFREDWPIVSSQNPGDVNLATTERLMPSDSPVIAYRKMHRTFTQAGVTHDT